MWRRIRSGKWWSLILSVDVRQKQYDMCTCGRDGESGTGSWETGGEELSVPGHPGQCYTGVSHVSWTNNNPHVCPNISSLVTCKSRDGRQRWISVQQSTCGHLGDIQHVPIQSATCHRPTTIPTWWLTVMTNCWISATGSFSFLC